MRALGASVLAGLLAAGCAHQTINAKVSISPTAGDTMVAFSSSPSEREASEGARVRAEEYCQVERAGRHSVPVAERAETGPERGARNIAGAVGGIAGLRTGSTAPGDHRVKLTFICE
jgi:hypothetical protein